MFNFTNYLQIVEMLVGGVVVFFVFKKFDKRSVLSLNMLQLNEYKSEEYAFWIRNNRDKAFDLRYLKKEEKSSLVITERVRRLIQTNRKLNALIVLALFFIKQLFMQVPVAPTLLFFAAVYLLYVYQPYVVLLSNKLNFPKEEAINRGFYNSAQKKIGSMKDLKVVGITGSFGKTSTKFILEILLKDYFKVQNTPSSFNTPMGLSKIINNDLTEDKEIFLAELGAYKIGEIKEVAALVQPSIGVITAIGPTHMHLFKSIENIKKTKYELIECLPKDGVAIFNYDNVHVKPLADATDIRVIRYGMEDVEKLDIYAKDIETHSGGSTFTLCNKEGSCVKAQTILLGRHNISNILAGVSVSYVLGMTLEEISKQISKLQPVEHRLNIVDGANGMTIIDDAFNSNPVGARAALNVLSEFKEGRKIIITPGMVELGEMEEEENYKLGQEIAKVCDFTILVGEKRTAPIAQGLKSLNYGENQLFVVNTLKEATDILAYLGKSGDVVLFENDLPDSYSEA